MGRVFRCVVPAIPLTECKVRHRPPLVTLTIRVTEFEVRHRPPVVIPTIRVTEFEVRHRPPVVIPTGAPKERSGGICSALARKRMPVGSFPQLPLRSITTLPFVISPATACRVTGAKRRDNYIS
jgi:hypothetical protein